MNTLPPKVPFSASPAQPSKRLDHWDDGQHGAGGLRRIREASAATSEEVFDLNAAATRLGKETTLADVANAALLLVRHGHAR